MTTALVHTGTPPGTALAAPAPARISMLRPIAAPAEVLQAQEETRNMVQQALQEGRDFGKIPGIEKASLLKPGAERVALAFGCTTRFTIVEQEIDHDREVEYIKRKKVWTNAFQGDRSFTWQEERGLSLGLYRYVVMCELLHRETGQVVGSCLGSCSTMESKYIDRPRDCENTVIKMAEKRSLVGATLTTFGLSDQFTQDVEDNANGAGDADPGAAAAPAANLPACPKCGGLVWDNRTTKRNPKAPDYKCRSRSCDGVIFPPRPGEEPAQRPTAASQDDDRAYDEAEDDDTLTLEDARLVPLPGGTASWGGKGGTPLGELSAKMLASVLKWAQGKVDEATAAGAEPNARTLELLAAVKLVHPVKKAEAEREQASMDLDTPAVGAPASNALAPGKIEDALDPPTGGAAPLPAAAADTPAPASSRAPRGASSARTAAPATSGASASSSTAASTATSDALPARKQSLSELSRAIGQLLQDRKLTDDERAEYRKQLEAANTVEELEALNTKLKNFLDQPF
jgi:hypothetical protein